MKVAQLVSSTGLLTQAQIQEVLARELEQQFSGKKVLVLVPDHTRTLPLKMLFPMLIDMLRDTLQLDFMVALGTHPPLTQERLCQLMGITAAEKKTTYRRIGLFNHSWDNPSALVTLGTLEKDEIQHIAGAYWHPSLPEDVPVCINRAVLEYDHILIAGPVFPHEVAGFSGGAKYLFPGISGPEMINATHWLGALAGVVGTIGKKHTPVRAMIHAAAQRLSTPVTLAALVVEDGGISGVFVGDVVEAWSAAADFSAARHIRWLDKPLQCVLSHAPTSYDELWTAAKAMYKLEPAVANGGEVIIYAPHLRVVSQVHGRYIDAVGYHTLAYILAHWERFKHIPLGVLAHSSHVRGGGVMEDGVERPNVRVTLASQISANDCTRLNLGYLNPAKISIDDYRGREADGILYVPRAGEILYRLRTPEGE